MDFIVPARGKQARLVEAKAARTVTPSDATPLRRLAAAWRGQPGIRGNVEMVLVHRTSRAGSISHPIAPGVRAEPWQEFLHQLA